MKGIVVHLHSRKTQLFIVQVAQDHYANIEISGSEAVGLGDQLTGELDFLACEYLNNINRMQVLSISILGIHPTLEDAKKQLA